MKQLTSDNVPKIIFATLLLMYICIVILAILDTTKEYNYKIRVADNWYKTMSKPNTIQDTTCISFTDILNNDIETCDNYTIIGHSPQKDKNE